MYEIKHAGGPTRFLAAPDFEEEAMTKRTDRHTLKDFK